MRDLLVSVAERSGRYIEGLNERWVFPSAEALDRLEQFNEPLPEDSVDPESVISFLAEIGSDTTVATTGGRYFGFVTGGSLPAALAAGWLAGVWDQNAGLEVISPLASTLESVCTRWLVDTLSLPTGTAAGFVTGATMANFSGLAAARHALLQRQGWDVESQGLFAAPPLTVVVGDEVHVSLLKALSLLGLGRGRVIRVPVDKQGRMRPDVLPPLTDTTIVCIQAGNVNTGAFDPATEICAAARAAKAWVHVDGAFGLWAAAAPGRAHLTAGIEQADSWATDAHKWLNVPYDSGLVFCRHDSELRGAMSTSAAYLIEGEKREPSHYTPELSRRARGIEIWAALRSLGRTGLANLVERSCEHASRFAQALNGAGYEVLNDVVLNQVLVSFGDAETTRRIISEIQADGTCWCGGTVWQERTAMRISVSSWATTANDVERSIAAILRIAARHQS
ncbi:MAG TPA: aminotransferase class V-fold PLP-dependent enzyme [Anaerolineae bacterium]